MTRKSASTIYGNLDLLVLHTLRVAGSAHGLGIIDAIENSSNGGIQIEDGALYHALHRLEGRGLLESEWRTSKKNRKAKFYTLTPAGESELDRVQQKWVHYTHAISMVLGLGWESAP
jgi:transcriptional regulator